jgi:phosphotriesterase-related protein
MAQIPTVTGPVEDSELGLTLIHEHVRFRDEAVAAQWPDRYDPREEMRVAVEAVAAAAEHGVRTIVEPTAMFGGRDIAFMQEVSQLTGVRLVPCTGIYTYDYLPHYFQTRDADEIAEHFVHDITVGIQGTDVRAAFLKCAADAAGVTENIEKVHRAVARASNATGASIMAHSMPAVGTGPRQVEIFLEEGVPPERIQIAHCGDSADVEYIEGLIAQGVYVGLDRYGIEMYLPIDQRNATAAELLRRGHSERIVISQDFTANIDWFPPHIAEMLQAQGAVRNWSMTLVFEEVVPFLRDQGVMDDAVFETVFVENPRRWLTA